MSILRAIKSLVWRRIFKLGVVVSTVIISANLFLGSTFRVSPSIDVSITEKVKSEEHYYLYGNNYFILGIVFNRAGISFRWSRFERRFCQPERNPSANYGPKIGAGLVKVDEGLREFYGQESQFGVHFVAFNIASSEFLLMREGNLQSGTSMINVRFVYLPFAPILIIAWVALLLIPGPACKRHGFIVLERRSEVREKGDINRFDGGR